MDLAPLISIVVIFVLIIFLLSMFLSFVPIGLWITAVFYGAKVSIMTLVGM